MKVTRLTRSLRKGSFTLELNHKYGTDSIRAVNAEAELRTTAREVVIRMTLKPVDGNQQTDADRYAQNEGYGLETVSLIDGHVRRSLERFLNAYRDAYDRTVLEVHYRGTRSFPTQIDSMNCEGLLFDLNEA